MDLQKTLYTASTWVLPVLIAITFHEAAHAYAAWKLGDDTAYRQGRVTFNPLKHVDPFGTILVPALLLLTASPFLFGWARPVPVAFHRLSHPRRDMALVAIAGPLTNVALAVVSALLFHILSSLPASTAAWLGKTLYQSILLNLLLAIFNMLPIPPLDGSRIALSVMPGALARPYAKLRQVRTADRARPSVRAAADRARARSEPNLFRWLVGTPLARILPTFEWIAGL